MRVFRRGKVWYAEWSLGKKDGKYKYQRKGGFPTKAAAQRHLAEAVGQPKVAPNAHTFRAYTDLWLQDYAALRGPRTYEFYRWQAEHYITPTLGPLRLRAITDGDIRNLYHRLRKTLQESTVLKVHRQIGLMCRTAVRWKLLGSNPVDRVESPKPLRTEHRVFEPEQIGKLLLEAQGTPIYPMLMLIAYTGLSRSEVLGLQWRDLTGNVLQVRRTRGLVGRDEQTLPTKRRRRTRYVVLPEEVLEALEPRGIGEAWIIPNSEDSVRHWMRRICERAGIPGQRFHTLRHAFASIALREGVPLTDISEVLGHADPGVTARVYSHALQGNQERTAARVSEALKKISPFVRPPDNQETVNTAI